jgi:hypothetical protein
VIRYRLRQGNHVIPLPQSLFLCQSSLPRRRGAERCYFQRGAPTGRMGRTRMLLATVAADAYHATKAVRKPT